MVPGFLGGIAHASEDDDNLGANLLAQGATGVANAADPAAVTMNPGLLGLEPHYTISGQGRYGTGPYVGWGVQMSDSKTSDFVAGGFSYHRTASDPVIHPDELPGWWPTDDIPSNVQRTHHIALAFGAPLLDRRLSFGMNGQLSVASHDRLGNRLTGNVDLGVGTKPVDWMTIGLVGRNLLPIPDQGNRPAALEGGIRIAHPAGHALAVNGGSKLERLAEGSPIRVGVGAEVRANALAVRSGYRYEGELSQHYVTAGLGLANTSGAVSYGVALPTTNFTPAGMIHQLSLRIFVKTTDEAENWE